MVSLLPYHRFNNMMRQVLWEDLTLRMGGIYSLRLHMSLILVAISVKNIDGDDFCNGI